MRLYRSPYYVMVTPHHYVVCTYISNVYSCIDFFSRFRFFFFCFYVETICLLNVRRLYKNNVIVVFKGKSAHLNIPNSSEAKAIDKDKTVVKNHYQRKKITVMIKTHYSTFFPFFVKRFSLFFFCLTTIIEL